MDWIGWGALSLPLIEERFNTPTRFREVKIVWRNDLQEELGVTADNGPDQRISVRGLLRDRLTEGEGIAASFLRGEI